MKEAVDKAIEYNDKIRRKKCMCCLKPPKRFPVPEDMGDKETATWTTKDIVYAPLNSIQEMGEVLNRGETTGNSNFISEISPDRHMQQHEEKLASPLPVERASNPLPQ